MKLHIYSVNLLIQLIQFNGGERMDPKVQSNQSEKLVHSLVQAIDQEPTKFNNYYELGSLLTRLQDFEQAEELFMKALGIFEQRDDSRAVDFLKYGLGNLYYTVDKVDEAIKYYDQVSDENLKADAYLMMAQSYVKKHDYKRAIVYGLTAYEARPSDPEIAQVLGDALLATGEFKEAAKYYDQILTRHPGRADTQFNRGLVAMAMNEPYTEYLEQAQQLDPDYYKASEQRIAEIKATLQQLNLDEQ